MSILIDIGKIKNNNLKIKEEMEIADLKDKVSLGYDFKPFVLELEIQSDGNAILVNGSFSVVFKTQCSKCLKEVEVEKDIQFRDMFIPEDALPKDYEESFEGNLFSIDQNNIDILKSVQASLAENLELSYLCDENCPGLCPICGKKLADGQCGCEEDEVDPRLEVLKKLKFN